MGTDSGLLGGTAVVDTNTKVYGTDNIFVVDASIFPGMPSTNPSAPIVVAAEKAAANILALAPNPAVARYQQCGGLYYTGSQACAAPYNCIWSSAYYSQVSLPFPDSSTLFYNVNTLRSACELIWECSQHVELAYASHGTCIVLEETIFCIYTSILKVLSLAGSISKSHIITRLLPSAHECGP